MQIKHLKHNEINYQQWDTCVAKSKNRLVYTYSWYLDVVSPQWEALVADEYEYIMPLPIKRKAGIPYLVQPVLAQQLGIFSPHALNVDIVKKFIRKIPYRSYHLHLNEGNVLSDSFTLPNYTLDLNRVYEEIYARYSKNTKRNIQKAEKRGLTIQAGVSLPDFLDFYYKYADNQVNLLIVRKLLEEAYKHDALIILGVFTDNTLISALALLKTDNRFFNLLPVSDNAGKESSAMFLIIDNTIKQYAGNDIIFDFEGSRTEGIARFYQGFGTTNNPYTEIKRWSILSLMKKFKQ